MSKHNSDSDSNSNKLSEFHFRGKGISRSEEKEINLFLGRAVIGVLGFAVISSVFAVATGRNKATNGANYITGAQVTESQIQSEQAAYQNEISQTVTDCSSAMDALSQHEQTGSIGISSDEHINRQIQLINLADTYCRVPNQKVAPKSQIVIIRRR